MRATLVGVGIGIVVGALAVWIGLGGAPRSSGSGSEAGQATDRETGGGPERGGVRLDARTRERLGLEVAPLASLELPGEVRGFGRLLDPAALAQPVHEREAARAVFEAADRELRRVQTLQRGSANASQRELEAARAAFEREHAAFEGAVARAVSVWGPSVAAREDLPALVRSLVARKRALARIDLPLGATLSGSPSAARVAALANEGLGAFPATLLGPAPDADPTTQGRGFLLLLDRAPWPSGTALVAWLAVPGPARAGVDVPGSAIVRQAGGAFAYVQTAPDTFARRPLRLEHPTRDGWFVSTGLAAGEPVVVTGAEQLLSAELAESLEEE